MKLYYKFVLIIFVATLIALAFPGHALAQPLKEDKLVFGDTYRLAAGETLSGNLAVFGGAVTLETGSTVTGDVSMLGGAADVNGVIEGNISIIGGTISLGDNAVVNGNVQTFGGTFRKSDKAQVQGKVTTGSTNPLQFNTPSFARRQLAFFDMSPITTVFGGAASALFMAALAMLVALFWPKGTARVAQAMVINPAYSGGIGCLTVIVAPALLILLTLTIILIPVSVVGILLLTIAFVFGWISFGMEIGQRISQAFNVNWHPAANAGLGTLVLTLIVSWATLIPFIGWLFGWLAPFVIAVAGLGGVLLTRFGTQAFTTPIGGNSSVNPPTGSQPPAVPQPPAPIQPPAAFEAPAPMQPSADTESPDLNPSVTAMDANIPDLTPSADAGSAAPDLNPPSNPGGVETHLD